MPSKSIFESKTMWAGWITQGVAVVSLLLQVVPPTAKPYVYLTIALSILNQGLRLVSTTAVTLTMPK